MVNLLTMDPYMKDSISRSSMLLIQSRGNQLDLVNILIDSDVFSCLL